MRYGHGKSGIIGITLKPETLKTWALSLHVCGQILEDFSILRENEKPNFIQRTHKEEAKGRISADQADREGLRKKLEMCINPLDPEQHPKTFINVINEAIDIGRRQMEEFERKLPDGFYDSILTKVETMALTLTSERLCHVNCHLYQLHFSMTLERCESLNQKQIFKNLTKVEVTLGIQHQKQPAL